MQNSSIQSSQNMLWYFYYTLQPFLNKKSYWNMYNYVNYYNASKTVYLLSLFFNKRIVKAS